MTTLLGPAPCVACRQPVAVVKRTAEVPCRVEDEYVPYGLGWAKVERHTHSVPDVALAVVDADGSTHICPGPS